MAAESNKSVVRVRPLWLILIAFVLGILLGSFVPISPLWCYIVSVVALLTGAFLAVPSPLRTLLFLASFLFLGLGRIRDVSLPTTGDVSDYAGAPSLWIQGRVSSLVETNAMGGYSFNLAVTKVNNFQGIRSAGGTIQITLRKGVKPTVGAIIWLRGRIERVQGATNPGAFDYADYATRHGIFCRMTVRYPEDIRVGQKPGLSALGVAQSIRDGVLAQTAKSLSTENAGLLNSLLLSIRTQLAMPLDDAFQRTGTVHILSVSGLHLTAFAGVLVFLFRYLLLPRTIANLLSMILVWLFVLAAGASAAPLRAAVMATVFLAAPLLRRTAEPLHTLAIAGLLLLFASPGSLYDAGFQLSFASVGGLMLFMPPLSERFFPVEQGQSLLQRFCQVVLQLLLVGIIAELVTAPLVAYHFNQWSLVAPFANVMITVWSEWLLLTALGTVVLSSILGWILPMLVAWVWLPVAWGLWLLRFLTYAFAALPFAAKSVPSPPLVGLFIYYFLLGGSAFYVRRYCHTTPVAPAGTVPPTPSRAVLPSDQKDTSPTNHLP